MPPSTTEYKREMARNSVEHPETSVDNRVKKRYPVAVPSSKSSSSKNQKHRTFFTQAPDDEVKIKQEPKSPSGSKRNLEATSSLSSLSFNKKIKQESSSGFTSEKVISLLTSDDVIPETVFGDSDSDGESEVTHSTLLEEFLAACNIPGDDQATRTILRKANVLSWTDLVPSVQMTTNVLTGHGMPFDTARRLMDGAKEADDLQKKASSSK
ncbi:uncharacterized protein MELLADRAFT_89663 [Melampsora larici-populina 98AG31]|uniref:Uncharacterized protein n=1 Tax=Melampsora larici-populina (strain 98AG31 / pathotype 3-4-7) TaxID=747676 RepID=F4RU57_MELLP|nr:uncharacterized protein MELLADRAFT_89663 [Melampsora larici-populina 98AG31]EGG04118.1 hypothetical protein MELLADRAFT_89663 [Melampsora larici-populina 98AG31]